MRSVPYAWYGINRYTTLRDGLIAFYPNMVNRKMPKTLIDVAGGMNMAVSGSDVTWTDTVEWGAICSLGGASGWLIAGANASSIKKLSMQYTVWQWLFLVTGNSGTDTYFHNARSSTTGWTIYNRINGTQLEHRVAAADPSEVFIAGVYASSGFFSVLDEYNGYDTTAGHLVTVNDGAWSDTAAGQGALDQDAAQPVAIGQRCDGAYRMDSGGLIMTAIWNRTMSPAERWLLYHDPFILYADLDFDMDYVDAVAAVVTGSPWYAYAQQ